MIDILLFKINTVITKKKPLKVPYSFAFGIIHLSPSSIIYYTASVLTDPTAMQILASY